MMIKPKSELAGQQSEQLMCSEQELISKRNQALWRSIKNFGDQTLEDEFRKSCFALSKNTLIKRQFIESINNVKIRLVEEAIPLT